MAGLLEKDIRLLWGTKQTLVILFAIAVAVAFWIIKVVEGLPKLLRVFREGLA